MYEDDEDYDVVPYDENGYYHEEQEVRQQQQNRQFYGHTISGVLNAITEYAQTLEKEKTNRANVERKRKSAIAVIQSERHVMLSYLKKRFGEREELYKQYFKLIDTALSLENEQILRIALESIQNIYQDSPCSGIDEFKHQFDAMCEVVRI